MMSQVGFEMLGKSGHRKEGRKTGQASSPPARWSSSSHTETREKLAAARFVLAAGENRGREISPRRDLFSPPASSRRLGFSDALFFVFFGI